MVPPPPLSAHSARARIPFTRKGYVRGGHVSWGACTRHGGGRILCQLDFGSKGQDFRCVFAWHPPLRSPRTPAELEHLQCRRATLEVDMFGGHLAADSVTSTIRRASHRSGCARCSAGAECSAIKHHSLCNRHAYPPLPLSAHSAHSARARIPVMREGYVTGVPRS